MNARSNNGRNMRSRTQAMIRIMKNSYACVTSPDSQHPGGVKLAGSLTGWVRETRTRSFYARPLTVGRKLLGVPMIGNQSAAGISRRAQEICERLAVPTAPAISLFAAQF